MIAERRYHCLRCKRSMNGFYDPEAGNVYHCARCGMRLSPDQQQRGCDPAFAASLLAGSILGSLRLAADSWQELRRGDVYRVIEDARDGGYAEEMARRIVGNRPDLGDEALACLEELT